MEMDVDEGEHDVDARELFTEWLPDSSDEEDFDSVQQENVRVYRTELV